MAKTKWHEGMSQDLSYLHLALQMILKDSVELLYIVLQETVLGVPSKGGGQFVGIDCLRTGRQLIEDTLECQGNGLSRLIVFGWDLKHRLAELVGEEQGLEK
jgi:hypothetical protein